MVALDELRLRRRDDLLTGLVDTVEQLPKLTQSIHDLVVFFLDPAPQVLVDLLVLLEHDAWIVFGFNYQLFLYHYV